MKWVFYLLLLGNALLFSYELRHLEPPRTTPAEVAPIAGPAFVSRLLLLSEVSKSELRERGVPLPPEPDISANPVSGPVADGAATPSPALCFSIGPLATDFDPGPLRDWVTGLGGATNLRIGERRERALYWVYFPPLQSREAAINRVEGMRSEGIGDIYIIPKGDMANAVSLGVYSQRKSLDRRLSELRAKGYEPSIVPRYRTRRASWLDAAFRSGFDWPGERFIARFPDLEFSQATCTAEQIASLPELPYNPPARRKYLYSDQGSPEPAAPLVSDVQTLTPDTPGATPDTGPEPDTQGQVGVQWGDSEAAETPATGTDGGAPEGAPTPATDAPTLLAEPDNPEQ